MKKEIDRKFIRDLRRPEYIKEYYKEKYKKDIESRGSAMCFPEEWYKNLHGKKRR